MIDMAIAKGSFTKSGIVLVNKPAGISSNKVVNIVKYALGAKKCGHLGTLDLEGEGLLPVTVNSATKLFDFFLDKDKTYETVFEFGVETDTLDLSGEVTKTKACHVTKSQVEKVASEMIGRYAQMPPQYSAKKVGGKVAYKEARKGRVVELQPKEIEIYDIKVLQELKENVFKFSISCSSGTYIRCIARDMAEKLSTYGIMHCILRTRCGSFKLEDANNLEEIKNGKITIIPTEKVLEFEEIKLSSNDAEKLLNGQILTFDDCSFEDGIYKIYGEKFLGLGEVKGKNLKLTLRLM